MSVLSQRLKAAPKVDDDRCNFYDFDFGDGGDPVRLYATPITGADVEYLTRKHKDFLSSPTLGASVDMFIRKCRLEDGEAAFDVGDRKHLLDMPLEKLGEMRDALFPGDGGDDFSDEGLDTVEKN